MRFCHKISYVVKNYQEFCAIHNILDKFNYSKTHKEVYYAFCSETYIELALNSKDMTYGFVYGPMAHSEYVECKNLTDLHNKVLIQQEVNAFSRVMNMAVEEAQDAFDSFIRACGKSVEEVQKITTLLYNIGDLEPIDDLTEEELQIGTEIMSKRYDGWLYTEFQRSNDVKLIMGRPNQKEYFYDKSTGLREFPLRGQRANYIILDDLSGFRSGR